MKLIISYVLLMLLVVLAFNALGYDPPFIAKIGFSALCLLLAYRFR